MSHDPDKRRRDKRATGFISMGIGAFMLVSGVAFATLGVTDGRILAVLGLLYFGIGYRGYVQSRRTP